MEFLNIQWREGFEGVQFMRGWREKRGELQKIGSYA